MKNEVGITLVALIVTIIILLILAGISIQGLTQTGLFEKANQSKRTTENSQEEENIILGSYEYKQELEEVTRELNKKNETLEILENKINEIVDSSTRENNSAQQQPNRQNTMSGEEHFIGEYYFNGKPIYEKTIYINSLSNKAGMKDYNHKISNVDEIWFNTSKSFIKWKNLDGTPVAPFTYVRLTDNSAHISLFNLTNAKFSIEVGTNRSTLCAYVTINYTKTTDSNNGNTISPTSAN